MENSPLSDRFIADEDDAVLELGSRDEQRSHDHASPSRPATHTRPTGKRTPVRSWMRVGAVDWGIRIAVVGLVIGGFYAVYVNGVAEGWWHAWGDTPTVAATGPTAAPTPAPTVSSEPAMSGGYQIGPDGVLVRPAEFAADTYTKPELPEAAKENSERGAEAAAEHYLALLVYAWNTGDTQPFADMSSPSSQFASAIVRDVNTRYDSGWTYGMESNITHVLRVEPIEANGKDVPEGSIVVKYRVDSYDGTYCTKTKVHTAASRYKSTFTLIMTWRDGQWIETQGRFAGDE
ncbi:hypothetical protein HMPREF1137_1970 [Actinomyces sp. ICM39]|nr:hypothetical protein HMPREF1137_1970 [Actinomyces sp. ICM39]